MTGLALATFDVALPPGQVPEWVHLLPGAGEITGRNGRKWQLVDPAALAPDLGAKGIDLPVDYEHQTENPVAKLRGPVPAAGWIKERKVADNGVRGRVEWTATAAEMIVRKDYSHISPTFLYHAETGQIARLKSAGPVHNPNLYLTALANREDAMDPKTAPAKPGGEKPTGGDPAA